MTSYGADLTNLFRPPSTPYVEFVQGTIVYFDPSTGMNQVEVGGATLSNLPFLNTGGQVSFKAFQVAMLMRMGASYFILGVIEGTGPDTGFGNSTFALLYDTTPAQGFALTTGDVGVVSRTFDIPTWATSYQATAILTVVAENTTGAVDFLRCHTRIADTVSPTVTDGAELFAGVPGGSWGQSTAHGVRAVIGFPRAGGTVTISGQVHAQNAAWTSQAANQAVLTTTIQFFFDS